MREYDVKGLFRAKPLNVLETHRLERSIEHDLLGEVCEREMAMRAPPPDESGTPMIVRAFRRIKKMDL